jgi:hypothetical protein
VSDKSFPIRKSALWLCWNIVSLGTIDQIIALFGDSDIVSSLRDNVEDAECETDQQLLFSSMQILMGRAATMCGGPVIDFLADIEVLVADGNCPLLEPLFEQSDE